jgi:hypothetical protein
VASWCSSWRLAAFHHVGRSREQCAFGYFALGRGNEKEQEHLAAAVAGVSGPCWRPVRSNHESRAAARARAFLSTVGSRVDPPRKASPSPVVASRAWAAVNVLESSGIVDVAPLWGLCESPLLPRAVRLGVGSFHGPYNIRLHLTAPRETSFACSPW